LALAMIASPFPQLKQLSRLILRTFVVDLLLSIPRSPAFLGGRLLPFPLRRYGRAALSL
jgi:hypothetical protein